MYFKNLENSYGPYMKGKGYYITYDRDPYIKEFNPSKFEENGKEKWKISFTWVIGESKGIKYLDSIFDSRNECLQGIEDHIEKYKCNGDIPMIDVKDRISGYPPGYHYGI